MSPTEFLTGAQATTYLQYREDRARALESGTHYWQRIAASREKVQPVNCEYVGVWEDPLSPDQPLKVTSPSGRCLGELMAGGIHPSIEAHWGAQVLLVSQDGRHAVVEQIDAPKMRRELAPLVGEWVVDYRRCHAETMGPLTLTQAVEWVMKKDVPNYVWGVKRNRPYFAIIRRDQLPKSRAFRKCWRLRDVLQQMGMAA